ncbi:MAG: protoheme IX farnesyltransferase [Desulfuromonas sp.]|nr:MAG: protoheme IX farnesyltransferase [Desulfuromonas sp.]
MLGRLTRSHLSILVAFSALAGYLFHPAGPDWRGAILLSLGVWSLAAGASALNQAQEKEVDARMVRTRTRPLVTGQLTVSSGIVIAALFLGIGLALLAATGEVQVLLLGLFALTWYNLVYTPLKKVTPFAVLPGALCGALPLLMGWVLSGGGIFDSPILMLCAIVVLWQVPHFWLLALAYPEDARRSGLPNLFTRIRPGRLRYLSLVWIVALLAGVGFANLSGLIRADLSRIAVAIAMLLLGGALVRYHRREPEPADSGRLFVQLNLFMTLLFVAVAVDRFAAKGDVFVSFISALG